MSCDTYLDSDTLLVVDGLANGRVLGEKEIILASRDEDAWETGMGLHGDSGSGTDTGSTTAATATAATTAAAASVASTATEATTATATSIAESSATTSVTEASATTAETSTATSVAASATTSAAKSATASATEFSHFLISICLKMYVLLTRCKHSFYYSR